MALDESLSLWSFISQSVCNVFLFRNITCKCKSILFISVIKINFSLKWEVAFIRCLCSVTYRNMRQLADSAIHYSGERERERENQSILQRLITYMCFQLINNFSVQCYGSPLDTPQRHITMFGSTFASELTVMCKKHKLDRWDVYNLAGQLVTGPNQFCLLFHYLALTPLLSNY